MKKLNYLNYVVIACFAFVLFSCGGSKTPGKVAKAMFLKVAEGNYEDAISYLDGSTNATAEETQLMTSLLEKGKAQFDEKGGLKDIEILEETISEDGTTAKVKLKFIFQDGTSDETDESLKLDENGNWKCQL